MENIYIVFAIAGIFSINVSAHFVILGDFGPSEVANLTRKQEHKLVLQKLASEGILALASAFYLELLAINAGNSFYGFEKNETVAREHGAIVKATFKCLRKLMIQDRVDELLFEITLIGASYAKSSKNISLAFSSMCADLDSSLANETQYLTYRDNLRKRCYTLPTKIYHYGIVKSADDQTRIIVDVFTEPANKIFLAHHIWIKMMNNGDSNSIKIKKAVLELVKVPDKFLKVQRLYHQSINELLPLIKHPFFLQDMPWSVNDQFVYLQPNFTKNLWIKIITNIPDWTDYFECNPLSDDHEEDSSWPISTPEKKRRCGKVQVQPGSGNRSDNIWPVTTDFDPIVLQNMTLEEKHSLLLHELAKKNTRLISQLLLLELLAKSTGSDFFGFVKDEKKNAQNYAVCRAVVECMSILTLQERIKEILFISTMQGSGYARKTGDIAEAFNRVCLKIDNTLQYDIFYTSKRLVYEKDNKMLPNKTFQYDIGDPKDDQRQVVGELFNYPQMKKYFLNHFWSSTNYPELIPKDNNLKLMIYQLATVLSQAETVQRIYEQSIDEVVPLVLRLPHGEYFYIRILLYYKY